MSEVPTTACWQAADARAVFVTEALEGHEGIFLATHTPISGFVVSGSQASEITSGDERAVLAALSNPARRHAFSIVEGEPGSGKSHLIRWLSVNWPEGDDVKLLLQRADGSLEGALSQLQDRLPAEFKELFDNLGHRHRATAQGRANIFLSNLANALDPEHFDPPLEDVDWCRRYRPTELVGHAHVRRGWKGPTRILRLLEGANQERNSATASFNLFDIEDLAFSCVGVHGTGVLPETERLAHRLMTEAAIIKAHREKGWTAEEIEGDGDGTLKTSVALMAALNRRRNDAIQHVLGVSAEGLKKLFRQVREELARQKRRLVLLLEDITSWEGIDDSLIDVLVTNADTRGTDEQRDMCPLISVVGVTPTYYQKLHANYRARITHEIFLGEARTGSELQDVVTLRSTQSRLSFVARYLSASRSGVNALNSWREAVRTDPDLPPPNQCPDCRWRTGCHRVFGEQEGIGLYPFTAEALERMFAALNENDNGMTWRTPRGILQAILSPSLSRPEYLEDGLFPSALIENSALSVESRRLSPRLQQAVDLGVPDEQDHARMRRTLAYWGDKERADTTAREDHQLAFAGVPRGVFEAFDLPWIGGNTGDTGAGHQDERMVLPLPVEPGESEPAPQVEQEESQIQPSKPRTTLSGRSAGEPPSRRRAPPKSELERLRGQLRKWGETGELEEPSQWNKTLYDLLLWLDPRRMSLDPYTFKRLLTQQRVKIEGTAPSQRNYFIVKLEQWVLLGLEGFVALRLDKAMTPADAEFHRQNLAVTMCRLEQLISDYADRRLTLLADGRRWTPVSVLAQLLVHRSRQKNHPPPGGAHPTPLTPAIRGGRWGESSERLCALVARAWLRGIVSPDDTAAVQLRAILTEEGEAESDPAARCEPWRDLLNATNAWQERYRVSLREMVALPQGDAPGFGLVDGSYVAGAICRLRDTLKLDPVPAADVETGVSEFDKLCELAATFETALGRISRIELAQIRGRADTLRTALRGRSIRAHLARVDRAVETVSEHLPSAAPDRVRDWKISHTRLLPLIDAGADKRVEDLLFNLSEDGQAPPAQTASLLGWLARCPCRELEDLRIVAQLGDQTCGILLDHVKDCLREGGRSGSLEEIRSVGSELQASVQAAETEERSDAA